MFLIGLAGSLFILAGYNHLFLGASGSVHLSVYGGFVSLITAIVGILLIYLHLSQRNRFLRVFSRPSSVVTVVSTLVGIFAIFVLISTAYWLIPAFIAPLKTTTPYIVAVGLILGIAVSILPGIELASLRARSLWRSPLVAVFFTLSSYATGFTVASVILSTSQPVISSTLLGFANQFLILILVLQLILVLMHLIIQPKLSRGSAKPVSLIVRGELRFLFVGGFIVVGSIIPLLLFIGGDFLPIVIARSLFILLGGISLRHCIIVAGLTFPPSGEPTTVAELKTYLGVGRKGLA